MKRITLTAYNALHPNTRGVWDTERDDLPGWAETRKKVFGKRTMLDYSPLDGGTVLLIEGMHFEIVEDDHAQA